MSELWNNTGKTLVIGQHSKNDTESDEKIKQILQTIFAMDDDQTIFDNPKVKISLITVYSIVFFFCFFGNLMVILVIKFHWKIRTITKYCLGNLALANLCVSVFCVYQNLSLYLMESWVFGEFLCKMYHFVNMWSHTASIFILVVVSIERYMVILHPFICRRFLTVPKLRILIIGVWILSAIISSPRLYFIEVIPNRITRKDGKVTTELLCTLGKSIYTSKTTEMLHCALLFVFPFLVMTILYTKIILCLRTRNKLANGSKLSYSSASIVNLSASSVEIQSEISPQNEENISVSSQIQTNESSKDEKTIIPVSEKNLSHGCLKASPCNDNNSAIRINVHRTKLPGMSKCDSRKKSVKNPTVVGILVLIVLTFALCNLPFYVRKIYKNYFHRIENENIFTELSTPLTYIFMYANCAINPFLYAFMSKGFRSNLKDLFMCKMKKPTSNNC